MHSAPPEPHALDAEPPRQLSPLQHPPHVVEQDVIMHVPQSPGHDEHDSAASHVWLPHEAGHPPQSMVQVAHDSAPPQTPSPQNGTVGLEQATANPSHTHTIVCRIVPSANRNVG